MKILQINGYESPGRRFHGLAITKLLKNHGIDSTHFIWQKDTNNPEILTCDGKVRKLTRLLRLIERITSLQSVLYTNASQIIEMPAFKEADLVHLHIIHSGYLSIGDLPKITQLKPTVWTLHDPWAMTGHCIYPFDCKNWMTGCGNCPDLKIPFPLLMDNTRFLSNYKRRAYKKSNFDVIVASKWMRDMVEASPLFEGVQIHQVPFGIDLNFFSPIATQRARKRFKIADDVLVICFRAETNEFKGLQYITKALDGIRAQQQVCLLTVGGRKGLLDNFVDTDRFEIIDLGWTNNDYLLRDAIAASDIFLMPSIVEAFGVMAIEAMACGKPVIVFDGTSLPDVTFAPDVGISVPTRNSEALSNAIQRLIDNPEERQERGRKGRVMAELHYRDEAHAKTITELYKMIANR